MTDRSERSLSKRPIEATRPPEGRFLRPVQGTPRPHDDKPRSLRHRWRGLRSARVVVVLAAFVLICGVALAIFRPFDPPTVPGDARWLPVQPQLLENRLGLVGRIEPAARLQVTAPFEGNIKELAVAEGDRVAKGQTLLTLDTGQLDIQRREAWGELLKSQRNLEKMRDWENSDEVIRARRAVTNVEMGIKNTKSKLADTRLLFKRGIVARMEVDALEEQLETQELELASSQGELQTAMEKGQGESLQIAEMEFMNVKERFEALQALHAQRELYAPFDGTVLRPPQTSTTESSDSGAPLQAGQRVRQGMPLLVLASMERLNATARVEEADLHQLSENMPVEITGEGFEGIALNGRIVKIGSQAKTADESGSGSASYDVTISIDPLTPEQQKHVRLGMSARLSVVTYRADGGFVLPSEAVQIGEDGQPFVVHRRSMNDKPKRVAVKTGRAASQGVEVFGVEPGYVELPGGGE